MCPNVSTMMNIIGMRKTPKMVAMDVPKTTVIPMVTRDAAPAPVAMASGTEPTTEQGRHDDRAETDLGRFDCSRYGIHAAFIDTDFGVFDDQDGILGGQADDGQQTDLEVQVILLVHEIGKDRSPEDAAGRLNMTANGTSAFIEAARTRKTKRIARAKT